MKHYAGIGSRETPRHVLDIFEFNIAPSLCMQGYTLRSGAAPGADSAFERGCDSLRGSKEIWLPWYGFEDNTSKLVVSKKEAFELAELYHDRWNLLSQGARKLHARNMHQVLGEDLNTPVKFVVCFTPGGKRSGGTGQALRLASDKGIPVFDAGLYVSKKDILNNFNLFMKDIRS